MSAVAVALSAAAAPGAASAADVAVFGNNQIDDVLAGRGHATTLVTDAQLATPGFLDGFDVFVYTRGAVGFGSSLSAAAAANVQAFTTRAVLLNGDFADAIPADAEMADLVANSAEWAAAGGGGYVGEFNGAVAALTANANGFRPLDLVAGSAGPLNGQGAAGAITATAIGADHPVLDGVTLPRDPAELDFGAVLSGVDPSNVLATYPGGNPAVVVQSSNEPPVVGDVAGPATVDEGASATFSVAAEDPDGDPLAYAWEVDGRPAGDAASVEVALGDGPATVRVEVTVSDGAGHTVSRSHDVTVVNVAPVIGELSVSVPAGAACATGNAVGLGFTVTDPADPVAGSVDWGDLAIDSFASSPVALTHGYAAGTHTISVSASDDDGAPATPRTAEVSLHYATSGLLAPLADEREHRAGRTLPVKLAVTDCDGAAVGSLSPEVRLTDADGTVVASGVMRFGEGHYIHNLSTQDLAAGTYELTVSDPAFAPVRAPLTLRA